jgi:endonuclease III
MIMNIKERKKAFLEIFKKAERKFGKNKKRLASEGWVRDWQILIATIMSAQSRDETTIPVAEELFKKYRDLKELSKARYDDVLSILKSLNYNKTKAKNVIGAAKYIIEKYTGIIPDDIEMLMAIPGVGRKTANLVLSEIHQKDSICVDTHVHRLSNVLGLVKTKNPAETEFELQKVAPKRYWSRINRIFVLWGKEVGGRDKNKFIKKLDEKKIKKL